MAHRHVITAAVAVLFLTALGLPLPAKPAAISASPDQQLIHALLSHANRRDSTIYVDMQGHIIPEQSYEIRHKLIVADVQAALAAGADPNAKGGPEVMEAPAVMLAAEMGLEDIVQLLIDKGANVNAPDQWGNQILQNVYGPPALVQLLMDKGANINKDTGRDVSPFRKFVESGDIDIVTLMLRHGADVDRRDYTGDTPLMLAARFGHLDMIKLLLLYGADIHARGDDSDTAMTWAAASFGRVDNTAVLQFLIERGLSVNQKSGNQKTGPSAYLGPLGMAVFFANVANVKWLLAHGANINVKTISGTTLLSEAKDGTQLSYRNPEHNRASWEIIRLLKAAGAKN